MAKKDITIVIISRERNSSLLKSMKYWDAVGLMYIVAHHTSETIKYTSSDSRSKYLISNSSFGERCGVVKKYINTKYAIICSDDEVFLPGALTRMSEVLDGNPEIESVGGQALGIGKYGPLLTATYAYKNMYNYANMEDNSESRMINHFSSEGGYKQGSMYRLMRRSTMIKMLDVFSEISFVSTPYIYEITGDILINNFGKSQYLNEVFWIRNWIDKPLNDSKWNRKLYFYIWFDNYKYKEEVLTWLSKLEIYMNKYKFSSSNFLLLVYTNRKVVEKNEETKKNKSSILTNNYIKFVLKKILNKSKIPNSIRNIEPYLSNFNVYVDKSELMVAINSMTKKS
jgi:hypothetical protein